MRFTKSFAVLCASALFFSAPVMHASPIVIGSTDTFTETPYSQSNNGECCFAVTLTQISNTKIGVDVSLSKLNSSEPTPLWAETGGPHQGFAFNVDKSVSLTNLTSPWTSSDVKLDSTPSGGIYSDWIDNGWENGTNGHFGGDLTFDLSVSSGTLTFADFESSNGFLFAADFLGNSRTGEGYITCDGTVKNPPPTPEPSSLMLLGTGILGAASLVRRRMVRAFSC
jgi:hypothetical protein